MVTEKGFTEERFDYSEGRHDAPELIVMVGISGSGKSTLVTQWIKRGQGKVIRLNRDKMREMLFCGLAWNKNNENFVRNWQTEGARIALQSGKNVIIDDTNCIRNTRQKWEEFAVEQRVRLRFVRMDVSLAECVRRDKERGELCPTCQTPKGVMVGEEVIRRQNKDLSGVRVSPRDTSSTAPTRAYMERQALLRGGFVPRLVGRPWVLFDMDGTVANHRGKRNPYEEHKVLLDDCYEVVAEWIRQLAPSFNLCAVSGRHDFCGDDTCTWLEGYSVPFDHILMRYNGDNRPDVVVKQEILDELSAVIGKENIAFVLDDRPGVVAMWKANGLTCYPVRGGTIHVSGCAYEREKGYHECPDCGALENF